MTQNSKKAKNANEFFLQNLQNYKTAEMKIFTFCEITIEEIRIHTC